MGVAINCIVLERKKRNSYLREVKASKDEISIVAGMPKLGTNLLIK